MGLLLGEVTWGEHAVFPHNKGMKGKKIWLTSGVWFYFALFLPLPAQQATLVSRRMLVGKGDFFFAFFYLFWAVQYKFSSRHKQESLLQKTGDSGAGTAKVLSLGHCFCLGFLSIFFSRCPTAASEKTILFYLFACSLDYLCRGVESHFQAFLIAGDCHFQCAGSSVYRAFPWEV